jgi:hypothetical protein
MIAALIRNTHNPPRRLNVFDLQITVNSRWSASESLPELSALRDSVVKIFNTTITEKMP